MGPRKRNAFALMERVLALLLKGRTS